MVIKPELLQQSTSRVDTQDVGEMNSKYFIFYTNTSEDMVCDLVVDCQVGWRNECIYTADKDIRGL